MRIETPRLLIRELMASDAEALHCIYSDPDVMRYLEPPFTLEQTQSFVDQKPVYALVLKDSGSVIGHVIWHACDETSYELGWVIGKSHWNQGYASEVTQALLALGLSQGKNIVLHCHPEQAITWHIAEKFSFYHIGLEDSMQTFRYLYKVTQGKLTMEQRESLIRGHLGKTVEVCIDRPIGFVHRTNGLTFRYPINYGYLPGVMAGDGDEQDAYILGVSQPLTRFRGTVIAAIRRQDDNEDKLVVAPPGVRFTADQIRQATQFVEQYFRTSIETL